MAPSFCIHITSVWFLHLWIWCIVITQLSVICPKTQIWCVKKKRHFHKQNSLVLIGQNSECEHKSLYSTSCPDWKKSEIWMAKLSVKGIFNHVNIKAFWHRSTAESDHTADHSSLVWHSHQIRCVHSPPHPTVDLQDHCQADVLSSTCQSSDRESHDTVYLWNEHRPDTTFQVHQPWRNHIFLGPVLLASHSYIFKMSKF